MASLWLHLPPLFVLPYREADRRCGGVRAQLAGAGPQPASRAHDLLPAPPSVPAAEPRNHAGVAPRSTTPTPAPYPHPGVWLKLVSCLLLGKSLAAGDQVCWCPHPFRLLSTLLFLSLGPKLECCVGLVKAGGCVWPCQPPALAPGPHPRVCMTAVRRCCDPPLTPAMPMSALCPSWPAVPVISASEWGPRSEGGTGLWGRPLPVVGGG